MTELQKVQDQLNKALAELMKVNLDENELLYDYIFEAHRLVKKLTIPVVVGQSEQLNIEDYNKPLTGKNGTDISKSIGDELNI